MSIADKVLQLKQDIDDAYQAGYDKGTADVGDGYYDFFWDNFQQNGERSAYAYAFANNSGWNDTIFKPKYKFFTSDRYSFQYMFQNHKGITKITPDFFDLDKSVNYYGVYMFFGANIKTIEYDLRKCTSVGHMFRQCKSEEIKLHNLNSGHNINDNFMRECATVVRLRWVDSIASQNLDVSSATLLDAESIRQTISILSDSGSGKTVSFSTLAVDNAFETAEGLADGSESEEWNALVATKSNWTISLK